MVPPIGYETLLSSRGGVAEPKALEFDTAQSAIENIFKEMTTNSAKRAELVQNALASAKSAEIDLQTFTSVRITSLNGAVMERDSGKIYPLGTRTMAISITQTDSNGDQRNVYLDMNGRALKTTSETGQAAESDRTNSITRQFRNRPLSIMDSISAQLSLSPQMREAQTIIDRLQRTQDALALYRSGNSSGLKGLIDDFR